MPDQPQEDPESLFRRATRYLEFGESTAARDTLLAAVEIDPSFAKGWNSLGVVYKDLGDIDSARDCFIKSSSIEPEWTDPIVSLGLLEFSQKSYKAAKDALCKYMELEGKEIEILVVLARSAFHLDDCKTVQKVTSLIIKMDEGIYEAWEMRGLCHAKKSKFSSALVALNMALELDPRSVIALNAVGDLCYDASNYEGAVSFYEPSLSKRKSQPIILLRHGTSLWFLNRWSEAIPFLERYTELAPDDPVGWNNLGVALREKGEVTRSIDCYKRALKIDPELEAALNNMETAMYKQMIA
ncbi:MAG: tetratricopeptide repeat protein [Candidatus Thorarchaeota archaeon]